MVSFLNALGSTRNVRCKRCSIDRSEPTMSIHCTDGCFQCDICLRPYTNRCSWQCLWLWCPLLLQLFDRIGAILFVGSDRLTSVKSRWNVPCGCSNAPLSRHAGMEIKVKNISRSKPKTDHFAYGQHRNRTSEALTSTTTCCVRYRLHHVDW